MSRRASKLMYDTRASDSGKTAHYKSDLLSWGRVIQVLLAASRRPGVLISGAASASGPHVQRLKGSVKVR